MSYELLRRFLAMKVLKMEGGSIILFDRGMVVIPTEVIIKFQEMLEKRLGNEESRMMMFDAGRFQTTSGSVRYLAMKKELRAVFPTLQNTGDPSIEMGREVLKFTGMGDIKIIGITNGGKKIMLGTRNSPIADDFLRTRGKSAVPVCNYLRGVMCGVLESFYQKEFESVETGCKATGKCEECTFEFVAK